MLEFLKPISGTHSISRVNATIHIPQHFLKPKDIFDKIIDSNKFDFYPKKALTKKREISVTFDEVRKKLSEDSIGEKTIGFILESYNERGKIDYLFKLENSDYKFATISLENRLYEDWDIFREKLKNELINLNEQIDFYVDAISLNYKDEFIWDNKKEIDINKIFNIESEILNSKFLNSRNGALIVFNQNYPESGTFKEERTEIAFNNDLKRIIIDHHIGIKLEDLFLFSNFIQDGLLKQFNLAHEANKNVLKEILNKDVQELIKLK